MPQMPAPVTALAAGATLNIASGKLFEQVRGGGAEITIYGVQTDGTFGDLKTTVIFGDSVIVQDAQPAVNANGIKIPDDAVASGVALGGDQVTINVTNTSVAAKSGYFVVDITNL